jgi:hypothetical protein
MNPRLEDFVSNTRERFGPLTTQWQRQLFPHLSGEEWLDTATLAGMSIADIIHAVRFGDLSESDIDPQVLKAFHLQFPHVGNFVDFVQSHDNPDELRGVFSGIKGKLFELQHLDYLNRGHLPTGYVAKLAESSVQPGYDIIIEGPNHASIHVLQDKMTASVSLIKRALERYPNIDVYVPHQTIDVLHDAGLYDHIFDSGIDGDALHEKAHAAVVAADHVDGYTFPYVGEVLVIATEGYHLYKGKTTHRQFAKRTWRRGTRLLLANLVGYGFGMATAPPLHMVSVPVRWMFSRWDYAHDLAKSTEKRIQRIRGISDALSTKTEQSRQKAKSLALASLIGEVAAT